MSLTSSVFLNQKRNKQTSHELQKNLDSSCISFRTSSRKRQLKTSQVDTKLCQPQLSVSRCCINFPHFNKIELEPAIIRKVATCQRISLKKLKPSGSLPEPAILSGDIGQRIHCFGSCQLIKTWMYNIRLQAPKLARKCEIKHWYACGADGRKVERSVYRCVIAKFSRRDRFSKLWGFARDTELSP